MSIRLSVTVTPRSYAIDESGLHVEDFGCPPGLDFASNAIPVTFEP